MRLFGGLRPWVIQRLTALYMLLFIAVLPVFLALGEPLSFTAWRTEMSQPVFKIAFFLFFTSIFFHAWIGLRDILLDYVHPLLLRSLLTAGIVFGLVSLEGWVVMILAGLR